MPTYTATTVPSTCTEGINEYKADYTFTNAAGGNVAPPSWIQPSVRLEVSTCSSIDTVLGGGAATSSVFECAKLCRSTPGCAYYVRAPNGVCRKESMSSPYCTPNH
jgi:hypothetical protein